MGSAWAVITVIMRATEGEGRNYAPGSFNIMSQLLQLWLRLLLTEMRSPRGVKQLNTEESHFKDS